jgi:Ca2+-binding RTX toxin-like protein
MLGMGNEIGSHSLTHPEVTDVLTAAQIQAEFQGSKTLIEQQMSQILGRPFTVDGAAVPGAPESLATALAISQYYNYLSGGFSSVGAGYPGAFGYLNPTMAGADKFYFAPNVKFDFSLVEFEHLTPTQAAAEWAREVAALSSHGDVPILMWPWHDYAAAMWATDPPAPSPYTTQMFTDFIARAYAAGSEFVTLADLADRMSAFNDSAVTTTVSGSTMTASVTSPDAGKFALDLDNLGTQKIANVTGWYAYDNDSVFLPRNGGTYTIHLGSTADDVTHITSLPMRSELLSVSGNGTNLSFSVFGEGDVVIDLKVLAGQEALVSGGTIKSQVGDILTVGLGAMGQHDVNVSFVTSTNHAPVITSNGGANTASISIAENTAAVTTVGATDSDAGQTLSYTLAGGADAAQFMINSQTGALAFNTAPDFEKPMDQGANNVYDVLVAARDSAGGMDTQAIAVRVTDVVGVTLTGDGKSNTLAGTGENDTLNGRGGNDTLNGGAGNDALNGEGGKDVLVGGRGADTLTGGSGMDTFVFNSIDDGLDTISDFEEGNDVLNIRDLLVAFNPDTSNVSQFVKLVGTDSTTLWVNADGIGTDFAALATLQNIAMTPGMLNEMVANGNLILA